MSRMIYLQVSFKSVAHHVSVSGFKGGGHVRSSPAHPVVVERANYEQKRVQPAMDLYTRPPEAAPCFAGLFETWQGGSISLKHTTTALKYNLRMFPVLTISFAGI